MKTWLLPLLTLALVACSGPQTRDNTSSSGTSSTSTPSESAPEAALKHLAQGVQSEKKGEREAARTHYTRALERDPTLASALVHLVRLEARSGNPARELAQAAVDAHPERWPLRAGLLEALLAEGALAEAEAEAHTWIEAAPNAFDGHYYLAYALIAQHHKLELAEEILTFVLDDHERAEGFWLRAVLYLHTDRALLAAPELALALEIRPDFPEAHIASGLLAARLRRHSKALQHHRAAVEAAPLLPEAHLHLGHSLCRTGKPEQAAAAYQRARELRPGWQGVPEACP